MNKAWKEGEFRYCCTMVSQRGNNQVGHDPKTIATYLRLQAAHAFSDGEYEISARLGTAATAINERCAQQPSSCVGSRRLYPTGMIAVLAPHQYHVTQERRPKPATQKG